MLNASRTVTLIVASAACLAGGCASGQARQGTMEVAADVQTQAVANVAADVSAIRSAVAEVRAEVSAVKVAVTDESQRITETTQKALVAVSKVDNSTADRVVNRTLAVGMVLLALAYPVGKLVWLIGGHVGKRMTNRGRQNGVRRDGHEHP